ncbi:MAG: hypothetical protein E7501_01835 [Ruminococcus sp.]|nr:hypothetical protein [Ruminococcus sp.]
MKSGSVYKKIDIFLRVLMILSTLIFALFIGLLTALGWNSSLNYQGDTFHTLAAVLAVAILLISAGTVLCMAKKDIIAIICALVGGIMSVAVSYRAIAIAYDQGWTSTTSLYLDRPVADLWTQRLYPILIPAAMVILCSVLHFFSYEAKLKREENKKRREEKENAPAPKILGD